MKTKYSLLIYVIALLGGFSSCEDKLDIEQQGVTTSENFYKTDEDATQALTAVYTQWRDNQYDIFFLKNLLADDVYCGGGSRGDNADYEEINEFRFGSDNSLVKSVFSDYYEIIYRCNLVINNFEPESTTKTTAIAEAKAFRALAYFDLVTLWGTVPLVTTVLDISNSAQPNGDTTEIWAQIESDLTDAISVLLVKSAQTSTTRFSKGAAQALLGKAYLFEEKYALATAQFTSVVKSGEYDLIPDYSTVLRETTDFGIESVLEPNFVKDASNGYTQGQMVNIMLGWRSDKMNIFSAMAYDFMPAGWGFMNPRAALFDAMVEHDGENGYRRVNTMLTTEEIAADFLVTPYTTGVLPYGNEGYFLYKHRYLYSETENGWSNYIMCSNNIRVMRYGEVLLNAAEAYLQASNTDSALICINKIRARAQLTALSSVVLDDIKAEKRCELCVEGIRFQDLVRWGDAATVLVTQGQTVPRGDGTSITNSSAGYKDRNKLLPFPETELSVNPNLKQNPGW
jgi:starch-binding outer membrane protein, SusD/RagB family